MKNESNTLTVKTEMLPRTWCDILGDLKCGDVRIFPLEGQALNNVRHAISRMDRTKQTFRTKAKGNVFFIFCTSHTEIGKVKITRSDLQQIFHYIALYPKI